MRYTGAIAGRTAQELPPVRDAVAGAAGVGVALLVPVSRAELSVPRGYRHWWEAKCRWWEAECHWWEAKCHWWEAKCHWWEGDLPVSRARATLVGGRATLVGRHATRDNTARDTGGELCNDGRHARDGDITACNGGEIARNGDMTACNGGGISRATVTSRRATVARNGDIDVESH